MSKDSRMLVPQRFRRMRRTPRALSGVSLSLLLCLALVACGAPSAAHPASGATSAGANAPGRTLVTLGASDAYGIGLYDPDRDNWPTRLASELPQPTHLVNLGIPGATLAQAQQEELPVAIAQHAQIVVLWLAINDIINNVPLATYSTELRATLATLRTESPGTHVFVGNVPDLASVPYFDGRDAVALSAEVGAWNDAIAQACAAEGATLADLASAWGRLGEHPEYISSDGLHPSLKGAEALADFFDIVIRQTLHLNG